MRLLLDTHLLIWSAGFSSRLSATAKRLIADDSNTLHFSSASIWEIAIKAAKGVAEFEVDPQQILRGLVANDYVEVAVLSSHAVAVGQLPQIHKDPFDRILLAQCAVEQLTLVTMDTQLSRYPGAIVRV